MSLPVLTHRHMVMMMMMVVVMMVMHHGGLGGDGSDRYARDERSRD
jgi:hypothetical protein